MWNCEDCEIKNNWLFKETNESWKLLTHTGKIFNSLERKLPATIA